MKTEVLLHLSKNGNNTNMDPQVRKDNDNIPVVDLSAFTDDSYSQSERVARADELVKACQDVGFVYIKGHGVPEAQIDQAFDVTRQFYALPTAEKMKAPHPPGWEVHRGYSWPGLEKVSNAIGEEDDEELIEKLREVQDYKESYEVGSETNPEMTNVWPPDEVLPEWRPTMTSFYWICWQAAQTILKALALGLHVDERLILEPHSGHSNQLRLLHYPPIPAKLVESGKFARMPAHSDWSTITLLFQDDCGGLQAESPTQPGHFIDIKPISDTLILNIGDLMARWSNGLCFHDPSESKLTIPKIF